jgi:hypothetical protein
MYDSVLFRLNLVTCISQASTYPDAVIYAGSNQAPAATKLVKDKDEFTLGKNIRIKYAFQLAIYFI